MGKQTTQPGVQISSSLWQEFRDDVEARHGTVRGHLKSELENAIKEYLNASHGGDTHDRLRNIEKELQTLHTLVENEGKKKKGADVSSQTENRLRKIKQEIAEESSGNAKVHEQVVEMAIRNNAGSSDPTIRRYKELLLQDRALFPNPARDNVFFQNARDFVVATNTMAKGNKLRESDYYELLDEYGEDWWLEQMPEEYEVEDGSRGFQ